MLKFVYTKPPKGKSSRGSSPAPESHPDSKDRDRTPRGRVTFQIGGSSSFSAPSSPERRSPAPAHVMTTCVPQVSNDLSNETLSKYQTSRSPPVSTSGPRIMSSLRDMINRSQDHPVTDDQLQLDLTYITERIISMSFAAEGHDTTYRFNLKDVTRMLKTKHGDNYLILNLSEKRQDLAKLNSKIKEFGWPDHLAPPLERLCSICKSIDSWLNADINHVVVLHCKGGRGRIANVIAAYMHYSNICASADQALDRFAMKRFYDDKLGGLSHPSQRRYVHYFAGLLSGAIKINSNPLYLHHILIHGVPNFDTRGGCRPFIKVYQGMQPIFTSGVYNVTDNMQKVCISISPGIPLRGDILIKCYNKKSKSGHREVIWRCQFHTCAISDYNLVFSKQELDDAINDPRFPESGKVEFVFGPRSEGSVSVSGFKSDVTVPVDDGEDVLVRSDSYENFGQIVEGFVDTSQNYSVNLSSQSRYNANVNEIISPSFSSSTHTSKTAYSSNTMPKQTVKTLDEQSQLDELLNDLLSDQSFSITSSPQSPKSNDATTITTTTRTFTNYSATDSTANPDKVTIQRAEVTYKLPGQDEEKQNYMIASSSSEQHSSKREMTKNVERTSPQVIEREVIRNPVETGLQSPPSRTHTLPYRTDYENKYNQSYNYHTLDSSHLSSKNDVDSSLSWLQQQQQKLRAKRDGDGHRTEQEKQLVAELRSVQNKYYTRRAQSEAEEQAVMDSYRSHVPNGPTSPTSVSPTYTMQKGPASPPNEVFWPQADNRYNTYSQTMTESRSYGARSMSNKPPPSPTLQRSVTPTAPVAPPARSSSKDYMRSRSNSGSSWQQPVRPLIRQQSDSAFDREMERVQTIPRSYSASHPITPPHSPRTMSPPPGPVSTTTYTTYRTLPQDQVDHTTIPQQYAPPPPRVEPPPPKTQHHYITEVYVHRGAPGSGSAQSPRESQEKQTDVDQTRLDELEKSLQAASASIMASAPQFRRAPGNSGYSTSEEMVTRTETSHHYQMQQQQQQYQQTQQETSQIQKVEQPPPKQIKEVEEDRIMLRPIGPGVQNLEPEGSHTGTLGRPSTPGFPTGPGGQMISPTGTLSQQQVIQYQTQQQVHSQQYQTQQQHHQDGSLHIDTSPKMLSATMPRSPGSAGSPPSPSSLHTLRQQLTTAHSMSGGALSPGPHSMTGQSSPSVYFGLSRRGSLSSLADVDMVHSTPKFVKDTSKFWYKPNISREEAIVMLKDKQPGTFIIRDSNSFPGAFGLALKVAQIPPNVQAKSSGDPLADLVRHFLIEPTPKGVRLRGCSNEPVFGSLAALVYQHSITPLALPCKLMLPEADPTGEMFSPESPRVAEIPGSAAALLAQGAACNVIFLNTVDTESLTGPQAVAKAVKMTFDQMPIRKVTVVHFKVSNQGITLTDNQRTLFFRRHYPVTAVTYCGMDPEDRRWKRDADAPGVQVEAKIFGFVARKQGAVSDNACHLFAELDPEQPASAIVNFVTKVMIGQSKVKS